MSNRPKICGICGFEGIGPVGKYWVWCMRCGSVGNGDAPGEWIEPSPNATHGGPMRLLRLVEDDPPKSESVRQRVHKILRERKVDEAEIQLWLSTPQKALGDRCPLDVIRDGDGDALIEVMEQ